MCQVKSLFLTRIPIFSGVATVGAAMEFVIKLGLRINWLLYFKGYFKAISIPNKEFIKQDHTERR